MENLYIWFYTTARKHAGVPFILENKYLRDKSDLTNDEGIGKWAGYNPIRDGFPTNNRELAFPKELFFIVQKEKQILLDFMPYHKNIMIVSESFLKYLIEQNLEEHFETASLKVIHKNNLDLKVEKKYFAIRIGKFDDALFNFNAETKKRAIGSRDFFLYPDIGLKDKNNEREVFFLNELWYNEALVLTEKGKERAKGEFYSPEIYKATDFPLAYNNRLKLELLPEIQ